MGIRFLRHIERTSILAVMVEASSENPRSEADVLVEELRQYSPRLAEKPMCFILSKCDLVSQQEGTGAPEVCAGPGSVGGARRGTDWL